MKQVIFHSKAFREIHESTAQIAYQLAKIEATMLIQMADINIL
jgi:hypothetical protein